MYDVAIIDGQNIAYKAFSVHKNFFVNVNGEDIYTGMTFGFLNSLIQVKQTYLKENGTFVVTWDRGHTRRTQIYKDYKANRQDKGEWDEYENFVAQRKLLQKVLTIVGITQVYKNGEEADDLAGTISRIRAEKGQKVIIMSADKDFQQLIVPGVDLLAHKSRDNIKVWNTKSWEEEFGVTSKDFSLVLALMGDKGDNVPGIMGIGPKSAFKIVSEYRDLLYDAIDVDDYSELHLEDIKFKSKVEQKVFCKEGLDTFRLAYKLVLIDKYVENIKVNKGKKDIDRLEYMLEILQMHSFLRSNQWKVLKSL